jgi:hypothetical protein
MDRLFCGGGSVIGWISFLERQLRDYYFALLRYPNQHLI